MPMRLGMAGMWHVHTDGMIRRIAENPDEFRLVGGWDPEPEVVEARRKRWEGTAPDFRMLDSLDDLLAMQLDGVIVEGRIHQNLWWACKALESGRPVLLEKPAGTEMEDYRGLADLARDKKLHLQMTYLFRYMPAIADLLARVRRGELGKLYEFRARLPKELANYRQYEDEIARYAGGMFFEMAGHMVDLSVTLFGAPKRINPFLAHHHAVPGDFVDNAVAVYEYDHAHAILEVTSLEAVPFARRFEIYGTQGAFVIPHLGSGHLKNKDVQAVEICTGGAADWQRLGLPAGQLQIGDLREFASVVAGKKRPDYSPEHDLLVQETLLRTCGMMDEEPK